MPTTSDPRSENPGTPFPDRLQLADVDYFRGLNPDLTISDYPFQAGAEPFVLPDGELDRLSRQLRTEGYLVSGPVIPAQRVRQLSEAIQRLHAAKVLPVFITLYDEYWSFLRTLSATLDTVVGSSYRVTCDVWAWCVPPGASRRGWVPHRDANITGPFDPAKSYIRANGAPRLFTLWIPLTDATPHNSCIYVLPFPKDPVMRAFLGGANLQGLQEASKNMGMHLPEVRALPAEAGSVLAWSAYILHWGSESTDWALAPRISIGVYCETTDAPRVCERPFDSQGRSYVDFSDPKYRLSPENRLTIIKNIISTYAASNQFQTEENFSPEVLAFCGLQSR
jgi:hypothetical protein